MAIVKFYFHQQDKDKPVSGALVMQKNKDKWKLTSKPYTTSMAMVLMVFKPEILKDYYLIHLRMSTRKSY
ncbi:hypothetical protein R8G61_04315 [Tenacibaculum maritimum]